VSSIDLRYEVNEGLTVVERWNAAKDFLCYGRQGILAMNSREQQEVTTLSWQLLQNCLMLINTILVEHTIAQHQLLDSLRGEDRRALTRCSMSLAIRPGCLRSIWTSRPSWRPRDADSCHPQSDAKKLVASCAPNPERITSRSLSAYPCTPWMSAQLRQ